MSRLTPIEAVQMAVQNAWEAPKPGEPDVFPSTYGTASAVIKALHVHGYRIVDASQHDALMERARALAIEARRLERLALREP